ncbi:uncharacterized protein N7477_010263 [Penicillium maclennaniae]|uniref:uncharacterized protein n=1 Tax=Penicillium maclennaniae TaxID=1343394 RepID=UPI0025407A9A|nr:uncharacterized protein N7477_010263 [Penicillium maclennaniae]KAJ5662647.1 hypothetical protein N7477_010263 [Penicillium maclennaniae]
MAITGYFLNKQWEYRQILLGFEPLEGTHTGENLALALYTIINRHKIKDQILAITTNNTSNNKTIFNKVQRIYPDISIIYIPCMAYIIQLSLNKLLYRIKAKPKNDTCGPISYRRLLPSEDRKGILQTPSIGYAGLQYILTEAHKGVRNSLGFNRWNLPYFNRYCHIECLDNLKLNSEEWRQVNYLLYLIRPFFLYISTFSKIKDVTIHQVFKLYNKLFKHLEALISQLKKKKMLVALKAGLQKLREYYPKASNIYTYSTILALKDKLQYFKRKEWSGGPEGSTQIWAEHYHSTL